MHFYKEVFKFSLLEEFAYPTELLAFIVRKIIGLGFLILFWYVISRTNPDIFTFKQMVAYFLISEAVADLSFTTGSRFGRNIQKMIKNGTISNYLVKPIDILRYLYIKHMGGEEPQLLYMQ